MSVSKFRRGNDMEHHSSLINMIPFIDVMLVLLVIFIVAMPIVSREIAVAAAKEYSSTDQEEETFEVKIMPGGSMLVSGAVVEMQNIEKYLVDAGMKGHRAVVIAADSVTMGELMPVLESLRSAGSEVSLGGIVE